MVIYIYSTLGLCKDLAISNVIIRLGLLRSVKLLNSNMFYTFLKSFSQNGNYEDKNLLHLYTHRHARTHTYIYLYVCILIRTYVRTYMHTHTYTHTHTHTLYIYIYIYIYIYRRARAHTHTHKHTHTYIYTYIHTNIHKIYTSITKYTIHIGICIYQ